MHVFYGILIGVGGVIAAELFFNYSLGDFLKDALAGLWRKFVGLFR